MKYLMIIGVCLLPGGTWAQDAGADAATSSARSVSRFVSIKNFCPEEIPTNKIVASQYAEFFARVGSKAADKNTWAKLLDIEGRRMIREVESSGARAWCDNQRRAMEEIGDYRLFPR